MLTAFHPNSVVELSCTSIRVEQLLIDRMVEVYCILRNPKTDVTVRKKINFDARTTVYGLKGLANHISTSL